MRKAIVTLALLYAAIQSAAAHQPGEHRTSLDFGGGITLVRQDFGTNTNLDQGLGLTLGVLFKSGFLLRFDVSRVESKFVGVADFGFGLEPVTEADDFLRADATAGFLWNRAGVVRPFLRGGLAVISVESDIDSFTTGRLRVIADEDTILTYGGGVELGSGNHIFAVDLQLSHNAEVETSVLGISIGQAEFDFNEMRLDYRYRF